jgi:hypothetical protein
LVPAFEQFDIGIKVDAVSSAVSGKDIVDRLYEPATDPISLLLPKRDASLKIVTSSLQTLGWLHCAIDANTFLEEHDSFWIESEFGLSIDRGRRPWLAVYLAVLAVGILYSETAEMPSMIDLPQLCFPPDDTVGVAAHAARIWYEAALKEIERCGCSGTLSLPVVQALSVLTLCHSNFGEHQREWLLTGFATNMARCLNMHKLGTEATISSEILRQQEWSTPRQRENGRRLWWSCVIRDW